VQAISGTLTLGTLLLVLSSLGKSQTTEPFPTGNVSLESLSNEVAPSTGNSLQNTVASQGSTNPTSNQQSPGNISGTILDRTGGVSVGANVQLTSKAQPFSQTVASGNNGQFSFPRVPPGAFQLTVTAPGFKTQLFSGDLRPGQAYLVPAIVLGIGTVQASVQVRTTAPDAAEAQIKEQEKQRIFAVIPNFFVTYLPNPAPLNAKQKFRLAWKTAVDPVTFLGAGVYAGLEQAGDRYPEFGQGAAGYAKRYGAGYADAVAGIFIGNAILPSLFKQDPRYFFKGTGTFRSRLLYALASSVICKGDNQRWQPNYSFVLGSFAVGGISSLYVPSGTSDSASVVFQNALIRIGQGSLGGVLQEFIIPRLTPHVRRRKASER